MLRKIDKFMLGFCLLNCIFFNIVEAKTDKILAIVNESIITQSEVDNKFLMIKNHLNKDQVADSQLDDNKLKDKILNDLIDRELQLQVAQRNNIKVTEKDLDNAITNIAKRNNLALPQFQQELVKQGISYNDFRRQIQDEMTLGQVAMQALANGIDVSETEINNLLQQEQQKLNNPELKEYHLLDVLVPFADDVKKADDDEAVDIAMQVLDDLSKGAVVEGVVKKYNVHGKSLVGSDLSWRDFKSLPEQFKEIVVKLNKSDAAGPVKAPNGFHIIILLDVRKPASSQPIQIMSKDDAKQMIYHQKITKAMQPWLQQLRASAYIKIMNK